MTRRPFGLLRIPLGPVVIVVQSRRPRIRWHLRGTIVR